MELDESVIRTAGNYGFLPEIQTLEFVNSIWLFQNKVVPLHPMTSHETGGGSESGALLGNL